MSKITGLLLIASAIVGCGYKLNMVTRVDPAASIQKADPIYVAPLKNPTIYARQALVELNNELCRGGFNVVNDPKKARWILAYELKTGTVEVGFSSQFFGNAFALGGSILTFGNTSWRKDYADVADISLGIYPIPESESETPPIMWEALGQSPEKVFRIYQPVVFKALLDQYPKNFNGYIRLSKSYLYETQEMGPCKR